MTSANRKTNWQSPRGRVIDPRWRFAMVGAILLLTGCGGAADGAAGVSEVSDSATSTPSGAIPPAVSPSSPSEIPAPPAPPGSGTAGSSLSCDVQPCYLPPVDLGYLADDLAPEASGIAPSSTDPDLFFTVDDSSGTDRIIAIDGSGATSAIVTVTDMDAGNAEALSPGPCDNIGERCLYIGDIGDNELRRDTITVYRIAEPDIADGAAAADAAGSAADGPAFVGPVPSQVWKFSYPAGARNAEAMLIGDDGSVIIITKPEGGATAHEIYRGPTGGGQLVLVNSFTPPRALKPLQSMLVGNVVTDASRLPDRVMLLTYDQAIEYLAPAAGADPAKFSDWPLRQLPIPGQWQSEGLTYGGSAGLTACGYLVVSEKSGGHGAQLGRVDCAGAG